MFFGEKDRGISGAVMQIERRGFYGQQHFVAVLSLAGTLIGSLAGILAANKLSNYRISQLEEKVNKHNQVVERTYKLEGQMTEVQHDIRDIKTKI